MESPEFTYYSEKSFFHGFVKRVMGTRFDILVLGLNESKSKFLWNDVCALLSHAEKVFDRFDDSSEVSNYNLSLKDKKDIFLSKDLSEALDIAEKYNTLTDGNFDIRCSGEGVDFGGFAKGWALKQIKSMLDDVESAFVDLGSSSILAKGHHPALDCWKVDLQSPFDGKVITSFNLKDTSLSTSGNTPSYSGHILNPMTGESVKDNMLCTVLCPDPLDAEVLSTALMVGEGEWKNNFKDAEFKRYYLS